MGKCPAACCGPDNPTKEGLFGGGARPAVYTIHYQSMLRNHKKTFAVRVRDVVRGIRRGTVKTYGEIAGLAGSPGAARAVGTVMRNNFDKTVPCHRVVKANGEVGEYNRGGSDAKMRLLRKEGVRFIKNRCVL